MKSLSFVAAIAAFVVALSVQASNLTLRAGQFERLPECGGSAELRKVNGQVNLVLNDVKFCSNVYIPETGLRAKLDESYDRTRSGSFTLPKTVGYNTVQVIVSSNSQKTQDTIDARFLVTSERPNGLTLSNIRGHDYLRLPECGGTVELKVTHGNAYLIFREVQQCSNFDIRAANGYEVGYPNLKLQNQGAYRGGSFQIPARLLEIGLNSVIIDVKSNSGKHDDKITVELLAL